MNIPPRSFWILLLVAGGSLLAAGARAQLQAEYVYTDTARQTFTLLATPEALALELSMNVQGQQKPLRFTMPRGEAVLYWHSAEEPGREALKIPAGELNADTTLLRGEPSLIRREVERHGRLCELYHLNTGGQATKLYLDPSVELHLPAYPGARNTLAFGLVQRAGLSGLPVEITTYRANGERAMHLELASLSLQAEVPDLMAPLQQAAIQSLEEYRQNLRQQFQERMEQGPNERSSPAQGE